VFLLLLPEQIAQLYRPYTSSDVMMTLNARKGVTQITDNPLQHLGLLGPAHP
jgi:hypothetical protein